MILKISENKGVDINKRLIGLFFEDINYGADGGLYGEYIENRSFEFLDSQGDKNNYIQKYDGGYGWYTYPEKKLIWDNMTYHTEEPMNSINPHYMRFKNDGKVDSFCNKAYDGIYMKKDLVHHIDIYARSVDYTGDLIIKIITDNIITAQGRIKIKNNNKWNNYKLDIISQTEVEKGDFVIQLEDQGSVDFDFISMFPGDAVLGLFRRDLTQLLKELNPGFIRFPGGCIIEGNTIENRYKWKDSIGHKTERKNNWNRWAVHENREENNFKSIYSHYNQTLGLGYYEYFLLCEYLGAEPLPVLSVGLACQFMSDELIEIKDKAFKEYIEDALDLIEFANGSKDSKWGKIRCEMGHEAPFDLKMIGIGNEQWQTEKADFFERYEIFEKEIHKRYKDIKLIGSAGPDVTSENYTNAWKFYREKQNYNKDFTMAVDEHYYVKPQWLMDNNDFYDKYPRDVKVFAGEYAAHPENIDDFTKKNNLIGALSEASFLTGIERNADVVELTSYAPLLARIGYSQWSPDMIWFDGKSAYGSPSYYVQKMFSNNMGDHTLEYEIKEENKKIFLSTSYLKESSEIIVKIINLNESEVELEVEFPEKYEMLNNAEVQLLTGDGLNESNSLWAPCNVSTDIFKINLNDDRKIILKGNSFYIIKFIIGKEMEGR